jgi:hypothetical protein
MRPCHQLKNPNLIYNLSKNLIEYFLSEKKLIDGSNWKTLLNHKYDLKKD